MTIRRGPRPRGLPPASLLLAACLPCVGTAVRAQKLPSPEALAALRSSPLALTQDNFPDGYVGLPFGGSVLATGGSGLYSVLVGGDVPPGTALATGGGVVALSGVPTQAGTYEIRVGVSDLQKGGTVAHTYSLVVHPQLVNPEAQMANISDPEGFKFTDSDSVFFPANIADNEGFKFNDADSVFMPAMIADPEGFKFTDIVSVFGPDKPADPETFHFGDTAVVLTSAMISDAEGFKFGDNDVVTLKVGISPTTVSDGVYNVTYSEQFNPVGYTGTASISESGTLPTGITFKHVLNQNYVLISGTPTETGTFPFTLTVTDTGAGGTSTINYTLLIRGTAQTITVGTLPTPTYGGSAFSLTGDITASSGLTPTIALNSGPVTGSGFGPYTITGAGTANFTATQTGNAEYSAAMPVNFNVTIAPAILNVTATNASRAFGQPNPSFSYSFGTFVNGDTSSVVSGTPVFTTSATPLSPVSGNPYLLSIFQGSLAAANYSFSFTYGSLTVTQAPQTITFHPLPTLSNGKTFPLTARASSGLAVTYAVSGPASISNNVLTVTGSGMVQVTASQSGNSNYNSAISIVRSFTAP